MLYELEKNEILPEVRDLIDYDHLPPDSHVYRATVGFVVDIPDSQSIYVAYDDRFHRCALYVNIGAEVDDVFIGLKGGWCPSDPPEEYKRFHKDGIAVYTREDVLDRIAYAVGLEDTFADRVQNIILMNVYMTTQRYSANYDFLDEIILTMQEAGVYPFGDENLSHIPIDSSLNIRELVIETRDLEDNLIESKLKFLVDKDVKWLN